VWRCVGPQGDIDEPTKICGSTDENKCKVGGKNYNPAYTCQWVRDSYFCEQQECPQKSGKKCQAKTCAGRVESACYAECVKENSVNHPEWCINP